MARRALTLGEAGEFELLPQAQVDGKWQKAPQVRQAKRWRARVRVRLWSGDTTVLSAFGKTKRVAEEALKTRLAEALKGGDVDISAATKLTDLGKTWLAEIERNDARRSERTIAEYKRSLDKVVLASGSSIRGLTISEARSVPRLRAFLQSAADDHGEGVSKMAKTVLSGLFEMALEAGAVDVNPVRSIRPVRSAKPSTSPRDHKRSLTDAERSGLMAYADRLAGELGNPRTLRKREAVADIVAFMCGTGVRISEALNLRWEHVDLDEDYVRLHGTKSASARRRLDLPPWLAQRLTERIARMARHYTVAQSRAKGNDDETRQEVIQRLRRQAESIGAVGYVFGAPANLDPECQWDQANCGKALRKLLDEAGLEWAVPHSFRRTVATRLHEQGVPLVHIADQLGHSSPVMTASTYLGRDFEGSKADIASLL